MVQKRTRHSILQLFQSHWRCGILAPRLVVVAFALACASVPLWAQEEGSGKSVLPSASEDGSQDLTGNAPDLGTGSFTRSPFHISVAVREGYDDNVYTTDLNPVGSFFTNGNVVIDYKFGNARTQLDMEASGGATYYYNRPFGQEYDTRTSSSRKAK
jgi:hypothetical protein